MAGERLTAKEEAFCREYLCCGLNASEAARRAGYSAKTAAVIGAENLRKPKIQARIAELREQTAEVAGITPVMVAKELARLAFADQRKLMEWGPSGVKLKHSDEIDDDAAAAVAEVTETTTANGGSIKLKLHDKKGALDSLNKMFGWNAAEKAEITGKDGGPIQTESAVVFVELPNNGRDANRPTGGAAN